MGARREAAKNRSCLGGINLCDGKCRNTVQTSHVRDGSCNESPLRGAEDFDLLLLSGEHGQKEERSEISCR